MIKMINKRFLALCAAALAPSAGLVHASDGPGLAAQSVEVRVALLGPGNPGERPEVFEASSSAIVGVDFPFAKTHEVSYIKEVKRDRLGVAIITPGSVKTGMEGVVRVLSVEPDGTVVLNVDVKNRELLGFSDSASGEQRPAWRPRSWRRSGFAVTAGAAPVEFAPVQGGLRAVVSASLKP